MRMHSVSHGAIGCAGVIAGYVIATGHLAIVPSFAQMPQPAKEVLNYSIASWRMFWAVD